MTPDDFQTLQAHLSKCPKIVCPICAASRKLQSETRGQPEQGPSTEPNGDPPKDGDAP